MEDTIRRGGRDSYLMESCDENSPVCRLAAPLGTVPVVAKPKANAAVTVTDNGRTWTHVTGAINERIQVCSDS